MRSAGFVFIIASAGIAGADGVDVRHTRRRSGQSMSPRHSWAGRFGRLAFLSGFSLALTLLAPHVIEAQTRLTLDEAIARASAANPEISVSVVAEREARARLAQARSGLWPAADFSESWQRGSQPVFVFSSLLAQRYFAESTAAIDALRRPTAVSNYRTAITVDAPIFDAATRASLHSAELDVDMAVVRGEAVRHDIAVSVVAAYGAVVNAVAMRRVVAASLESARADLTLAAQRRDQGLATDADLLQVQLHLTATRERQIRARADETVARARLNQVIGAALDEEIAVDDLGGPVPAPAMPESSEADALHSRPEARLAVLNQSHADATREAARAAFLPRVSATAAWEANGGRWDARSSGWTAGIVARVNLFRGFADRARLTESVELQRRRRIERESIDTAVRVDVRETRARLDAAMATVDVADAAVAQAVESQRIIRDRYESGLADVTTLLRAAESVQEAEARRVTARVELIVSAATWRRATGKLLQ